MTTLGETLRRADDLRANTYDDQTKTGWVNRLEGILQTEVLKEWPGKGDGEPPMQYRWPEDEHTALLAQKPYDELYTLYLFSMIDYHNREYDDYDNSMTLFNAAFDSYRKHRRRLGIPEADTIVTNLL